MTRRLSVALLLAVAVWMVGCEIEATRTIPDISATIRSSKRAFFAEGFEIGELAAVKHLQTTGTPCDLMADGIDPSSCVGFVMSH